MNRLALSGFLIGILFNTSVLGQNNGRQNYIDGPYFGKTQEEALKSFDENLKAKKKEPEIIKNNTNQKTNPKNSGPVPGAKAPVKVNAQNNTSVSTPVTETMEDATGTSKAGEISQGTTEEIQDNKQVIESQKSTDKTYRSKEGQDQSSPKDDYLRGY